MKKVHLNEMVKGWFVGDFTPTAFATDQCEVAVKTYKKGDSDTAHFHKSAHEITLIIEGKVIMMDSTWQKGDIIVVEPGEISAFLGLIRHTVVLPSVYSKSLKFCKVF